MTTGITHKPPVLNHAHDHAQTLPFAAPELVHSPPSRPVRRTQAAATSPSRPVKIRREQAPLAHDRAQHYP